MLETKAVTNTRFPVTIHHNPACGTSRTVLAALRDAGHDPAVIEYLRTGWTRPELQRVLGAMNARPRDLLREKEAGARGLLDPALSDDALLDAMAADPALVNRPVVETPLGVRLCRPADRVREILPAVPTTDSDVPAR